METDWRAGANQGISDIIPQRWIGRKEEKEQDTLEIEAKFQIPDEQAFQRLQETTTLAGYSLGALSTAKLHDHYLDTKDWAVLTCGYAYRLRQVDGRYLATLKGLGGVSGAIHRRQEHQVELPAPRSPQDFPPSTARDLLLRACGNKALHTIFEIKQTRHSRPIYQGERLVAELSMDQARLYEQEREVTTFLELEAELVGAGHEADLEKLATELEESWGLAPESQSKYARGLALLGLEQPSAQRQAAQGCVTSEPGSLRAEEQAATPSPARGSVQPAGVREAPRLLDAPGIEPDDPMSEAGRKALRFHYRRMVYHEPGTRLGQDIDALHDMRVATRRMRAAFRVFGEFFDPDAIRPLLKGLRRTGRALGAVRDLDVFRAKVQAYLLDLPGSQQERLDDLLAVLEAQRELVREQMIAYLDGKRYRRFVARFGTFVETPGMASRPAGLVDNEPHPYRVRHVAPMAIYQRLAAVRAYDEWVSIPNPPLARLHALRIACKRLRYTLEFFEEVLAPDTRVLIKEVVAVQDHLGDLQDAVVASGILRDYLVWGTWGHGTAGGRPPELPTAVDSPGVTSYLAAKQSELQHLLDTFPEAWQRLQGQSFSEQVSAAVAAL